MSPSPYNGFPTDSDWRHRGASSEDTLRLIARIPAPEGLVDRVRAGLRDSSHGGRVLPWRAPLRPAGGWIHGKMARGAAAAMIVSVVAGGGWTIYSRVTPASTAKVVTMPQPVGSGGGGFAPAGAKRVPETLQGPVLKHSVAPAQPLADSPAESRRSQAAAPAKKKKAPPKAAVAPVR
jgi:hypothetical protein